MKALSDTWLVYRRAMIERLREPAWVLVSVSQPLLYLFLFGPLLRHAYVGRTGPGGAYNVFVPALLVLMAYFVAGGAGFGLLEEQSAGVIERFGVTPLSRAAMVLGRACRDVTALAVQSALLLAVGWLVGLRPDWTGASLAVLLVCVLGLALSCLSNTVALKMHGPTGFAALFNGLSIVILLLSGVLLPLSLAPHWLRLLADANPLSYAVDASRALVSGQLTAAASVRGFAVAAGLTAITLAVAARAFHRLASS